MSESKPPSAALSRSPSTQALNDETSVQPGKESRQADKKAPPGKHVKSPKDTPRTLGPVPDLERHIPPEWWSSLFGAIYLQTDGDVVEDPHLTAQEVDLVLRLAALKPDMRVLDLCCG
ncbi:MAG: hypothetical protein RBU37_09100, partial [Myxococcota bacterium]|nr:hypothetical protein [Myxococcota bacterium]